MTLTDKTGKSMVAFWDWAAERGQLKAATARNLRIATEKVLEVDDGWEARDVSELDVEDILHRFETLKSSQYRPSSLSTYRSRFQKALNLYLNYVDSPRNWRPDIQKRTSRKKSASRSEKPAQPTGQIEAADRGSGANAEALVHYPFPLRPDYLVELRLPPDLREDEAKRLAAFVKSLAIDAEEAGG